MEPGNVDNSTPAQNLPQALPTQRVRLMSVLSANLLLGAMFAAGIAGLYLLGLRSGPTVASAAQKQTELQVDTALTQLNQMTTDPSRSRAKDLVSSFYMEARQRQIPLERLQGNPFVYKALRGTEPSAPTSAPNQFRAAAEDTSARAAVAARDAAGNLRLQSVLTGASGASALISNNLLTVGQQIEGWTVKEIRSQEVVLVWHDQVYVLRMEESRLNH